MRGKVYKRRTAHTHHQLFDQTLSFSHHLSELSDRLQILWPALAVTELLLRTLQPTQEKNSYIKLFSHFPKEKK